MQFATCPSMCGKPYSRRSELLATRLIQTLFAVLVILAAAAEAAEPGYFRQPSIQGSGIVFVAEGDLWLAPVTGGRATRLTTHPSRESHPAISPDGSQIAFTAEYEGPTDVYVMPRTGGPARRITFDAATISHVGWTPDGKVLIGTDTTSGLPAQQLLTIDLSPPEGGLVRKLIPLAQAAEGAHSADGAVLYFTRQSFQGSHTKRYRGGTAQQIWSFRTGDPEAIPRTADYPGTSRHPMFWNGRIYFASDRDGTMNLWSMNSDGGDLRQHSRHTGLDVATPAHDEGRIVYQLGADLRLYDIERGSDVLIPLSLDSDFEHLREKWIRNPFDFLSEVHLSPDGERAVITARGRVFVVPRKEGRRVEAARQTGVRYRDARFLPDGKRLLVMSDESGEVELWTVPADGVGSAIRLTTDGNVLRRGVRPAPDGKWIAHTDKNHRLYLWNADSGENKLLTENPVWEFDDLAWSPDSKWLAYTDPQENLFRRIMLYSVATGVSSPATTPRYDSFSPAFSPDGMWLYFLSDRNLSSVVKSPWGTYQPEPFLDKKTRIYQLPLTVPARSPFTAPTELDALESVAQKKDEKGEPAAPVVNITLDALASRLLPVPVPPGNYDSLAVTEKSLLWLSYPAGEERLATLEGIAIGYESAEVKQIADSVVSFEISNNQRKLLLRRDKELHIFDLGLDRPDLKKTQVNLGGWTFSVNPREEWRQMFLEAWRLERDYFYDRGMHGVDWGEVRRRYEPLLARISDRDELDDLLAQMVSELSALHIFVDPGDVRKGPDDVIPGRLGAAFVRDVRAGGYRVERVYRHDPDEPERAAPLARPAVDVRSGDVITAVNGVSPLAVADIGELLRQTAGREVLLEVRTAQGESRRAVVRPLTPAAERDLRYHDWEYSRRLQTEELGGGEIGYVHLRAMGGRDFESWARSFYPVFNRGGLIIDVRNNRGGNIDSWIIGRLLRKAWFYWNQRVGRSNRWNMQYAFRGHVVVLCNEWTMSDGEAFSEGVKRLKLGTILGTRTWGGEIWLTMSNRLVDKGIASSAEFGVFDRDGTWLIEGHGVEPDVVVDNLPHATFQGEDAQLAAAVTFLKKKLQDEPITLPPVPAFPRK